MANVPISAFTVPANTVGIGATGYSLTGSASASFMDLAGTWNTSGTPTAIKLNITDTSSPAGSLLMDLQVGGASRFSVNKDGGFAANSSGISVASTFGGLYITRTGEANAKTGIRLDGTFAGQVAFGAGGANVPDVSIGRTSSGTLSVGTNPGNNNANGRLDLATLGVGTDTILTRRGAANLRLGAADAAAPVAQTLSVQSVVAGTTNTAGQNFIFTGSQGTGTGAGGSLIFQVAPAGSSGSAQNGLATALTINSASQVVFSSGSASAPSITFDTASTGIYGGSNAINFTRGGSRVASIDPNSFVFFSAGANISMADAGGSADVRLFRDAANTLALRNGTAAQTFNVYNTFTDASNYERGIVRYSSNVLQIGHEAAGTGTALRTVSFRTNGVEYFNIGSTSNAITVASNRTLVLAGGSGSLEILEGSGVSAPAANRVRIYAEDDGAGKTRLMALFATGAAQQIAIEP